MSMKLCVLFRERGEDIPSSLVDAPSNAKWTDVAFIPRIDAHKFIDASLALVLRVCRRAFE